MVGTHTAVKAGLNFLKFERILTIVGTTLLCSYLFCLASLCFLRFDSTEREAAHVLSSLCWYSVALWLLPSVWLAIKSWRRTDYRFRIILFLGGLLIVLPSISGVVVQFVFHN